MSQKMALVVDDNEGVRDLVVSVLQRAGYQVAAAASAEAAIKILMMGQQSFDVVLTDVNMPPGISGIEFLLIVRENDLAEGAQLIVMSGMPENRDELDQTGLRARFLAKPFRLQELIGLLM